MDFSVANILRLIENANKNGKFFVCKNLLKYIYLGNEKFSR